MHGSQCSVRLSQAHKDMVTPTTYCVLYVRRLFHFAYDIRLKDIMEEGDMKTNINLMPGDIVTVPERSF